MSAKSMLVVFSGGQDSTTCLFKAIAECGCENVAAITFAYGQRHSNEVELAKEIARDAGIRAHKILSLDWYREITSNALLDGSTPFAQPPGEACPNSFVDGRNAFFILTAAVYAKSLGIFDLMLGVGEADYSGYPDCREVFIRSMNESINLAMDVAFRIHTPLMHLTKAQTWALADSLGALDFIRTRTLTCYNGIQGDGCGECPACKLRADGLREYLASSGGERGEGGRWRVEGGR